MTHSLRTTLTAGLAAVGLALAMLVGSAGSASAQEVPELPPLQDGLINVNVSDVIVQLPIAVAANVCDVSVNALAEQLALGDTDCDAVAEPNATVPWNSGNDGAAQQNGLVNVNVSNIVVQAPIGLAANVCDVNVNVLARQLRTGDAVCTAQTYPIAEAA
jgi:hypothetical protein